MISKNQRIMGNHKNVVFQKSFNKYWHRQQFLGCSFFMKKGNKLNSEYIFQLMVKIKYIFTGSQKKVPPASKKAPNTTLVCQVVLLHASQDH